MVTFSSLHIMGTGEISTKVFLDRGDARFRAHRVGAFGELLAIGSWQLIGDLFFGMRRMLEKKRIQKLQTVRNNS